MKLSYHYLTLLLATPATSFAPSSSFSSARSCVVPKETTTTLYISSWGKKDGDAATMENQNIVENIQAYLMKPQPVEARESIDGTILVSGLVKSKERTDQYIFDLLNDEESAFKFQKIVAFVDDVSFAKKRLLSRSARYTGLLDKLDFSEASSPGSLPTSEQLEGVKSWVLYLDEGDMLATVKEAASIASQVSSVENVAILLTNALDLDAADCEAAVQSLKDAGKQYTLVAVGKLEDHDEGKVPYQYKDFGSAEGVLPSDAIFSRGEALRMITECLQLECGVNKAFSFSEVDDADAVEATLIKGLREAGYARPQEIDHMLRDGPSVSFS